jgi:hypothetical protein
MIFKLSDNWHYCLADDPNYVLLDFDHSAWPVMHIPQNWFLAGLDYHGLVWFRYRFDHQLPLTPYGDLCSQSCPVSTYGTGQFPKDGLI